MSEPPLDPPPFNTANVRKCIKATVRIQNHDRMQEVLILTTVSSSVASQLTSGDSLHESLNSSSNNGGGGYGDGSAFGDGGGASDGSSELSSFSESSSSSEEDDDDEDCTDDDDDTRGSCSRNGGECNGASPVGGNQGFRMKAFWLRREPMCENRHGVWSTYVYYAKVLQKAALNWVVTNEEVAIKAVSWRCIRASQNRLSEDFVKEISTLQYLSDWQKSEYPGSSIRDTHVMTTDIVMSNETHLYIVMPFCRGGDLCQRVAEQDRFTEDVARFWFRQILKGLHVLQMAQICHRDLSPENFIILDDTCLVIDFGMSLRIPYSSAGRHLITPQIPCGKLPHMSPEIFLKRPFDGHAVDIWAAGTVLLFMLTGKRLSNPPLIDRVFDHVDLGLSYEAMDLLRKMFRLDPKDRLSLEQIQNHPFVQYEFLCQR